MAQNSKLNKSKQNKVQVKKSVQDKSSADQKKKSSEKNGSGSCCKFLIGSFALVIMIGSLVIYDTHTTGKGVFEKSSIGKVLKNAGMLPYAEKAWFTTMPAGARGYQWIEKNVPGYVKPISQLTCDLYKVVCNAACNAFEIARNFIATKWPAVVEFLEQYIPGFGQKIDNACAAVQSTFSNIFASSVHFFKTQVFTGNFSPENLGKALNKTQTAAIQYYSWFHNKVDAYAKLK